MSPHPSLDGRTPYEVYAAWDGPITRIADEAALAVLLLPLADGDGGWRTVLKKGVHVGGHQYIHAALGEYAGQRVLVRMDEADIPLKPEGVRVAYYALTPATDPDAAALFAWDCDSAGLDGWGRGNFPKILNPS